MKKLLFAFALVALGVAFFGTAQAFQVQLGVKQISVNFTVTPSPIAYAPTNATGVAVAANGATFASFENVADYLGKADPLASIVAYEPMNIGDMVAQSNQAGVKVQFTVKVDPTYQYFHLIPVNTNLNAGYGANTYTCSFQVFAKYATAWTITDYAYGSSSSGNTQGLGGFPLYNYATTSDLAWLAETITTSYKAYANAGSPGETVFAGAAGSSKTICIDLNLSVPASIPAGTYTATISYRMVHN